MKILVNFAEVLQDIVDLIKSQLPDYLTALGATQFKTCSIGYDYADSSIPKPCVLVYPDFCDDVSEEQGVAEKVVHVGIGVFINGTKSDKNMSDILAYASSLISIFTNIQETDHCWQATVSESSDFTSLGSGNYKIFTMWIDCHVRSEVEVQNG